MQATQARVWNIQNIVSRRRPFLFFVFDFPTLSPPRRAHIYNVVSEDCSQLIFTQRFGKSGSRIAHTCGFVARKQYKCVSDKNRFIFPPRSSVAGGTHAAADIRVMNCNFSDLFSRGTFSAAHFETAGRQQHGGESIERSRGVYCQPQTRAPGGGQDGVSAVPPPTHNRRYTSNWYISDYFS